MSPASWIGPRKEGEKKIPKHYFSNVVNRQELEGDGQGVGVWTTLAGGRWAEGWRVGHFDVLLAQLPGVMNPFVSHVKLPKPFPELFS